MIASDVPAAFPCGTLKKRTRTGIARKPPPIPNNPVIDPITSEITISHRNGTFFSVPAIGLINIDVPAVSNTIEKPVVITESLKRCAMTEKPRLVTSPNAQIIAASLNKTSLLFIFGNKPEIAALKTTAIAAVVAA